MRCRLAIGWAIGLVLGGCGQGVPPTPAPIAPPSVMRELEPVGDGRCAGAIPGPPGPAGIRPRLGEVQAQASTVDVYCVYNAGVVTALGSLANVTARTQALVSYANTAYANSKIDLTLRLVGSEEVQYTQSSLTDVESSDLTALRSGPEFAAVRNKRATLGIDLFCLLLDLDTVGPFTSGIAYVPSLATGLRADLGYSVVSLNGGGGTFTHELGHNFGCGHDLNASAAPLPPSEALYPFGYGFRKPGVWGTVMAYRQSGETRIPYFSNPTVSYQGDPTGVAGSAENAQVMSLSMGTIANYAAAVEPTPTPTPLPTPTPDPSPGSVLVDLNTGWNSLAFQSQRITFATAPGVVGMAWFDGAAYQTRTLSPAALNDEGDGTRRGFWLFANGSTVLNYGGEADNRGNFVNLKSGWNLVGFVMPGNLAGSSLQASQNGQSVSLGSVVLSQFTEILPDNRYATVDVLNGGQLRPGRAYFVFASQSVRLSW